MKDCKEFFFNLGVLVSFYLVSVAEEYPTGWSFCNSAAPMLWSEASTCKVTEALGLKYCRVHAFVTFCLMSLKAAC